jgi:cyclopropane-fatty-acyl-phospholipid synthase
MGHTPLPATPDPAVRPALDFLTDLFQDYRPRDFAVRFWDGTTWEPESGQPARFTICPRHAGAVRRMFWPPNQYSFGEAYVYDDYDIEGDVLAFCQVVNYLRGLRPGLRRKLQLGWRVYRLPAAGPDHAGLRMARLSGARHSPERDRQAVSFHYDVSNDFFRLWLDRRMVYSCAYFADPDESLDAAQERKLDYICRKLRLQPGERLLDIGCGWGGLVTHAAQKYGVEAVGITLSKRQAEYAAEHVRAAGLEGRCRIEFRDYREATGQFDKLVSVGMCEHVGAALMPTYFRSAWNLLRPGGVFLNHGIALAGTLREAKGKPFSDRHVFPDGELVPISATLRAAEELGFEVRDVENLREHYTLTLERWVRALEAHADEARRLTDDTTYRVWRLYMAGAANGFRRGDATLCQSLLVKPDGGRSGLPLTRADWYAAGG